MSKSKKPKANAIKNEIARVRVEYPIPPEFSEILNYQDDIQGGIFLYVKSVKGEEGQEREYLTKASSPIGVYAKIRKIDQQDSYALRIVLMDLNGKKRTKDINRAELLGSTVLSRLLLNEGVRLFRKEGRDAVVDMLSTCNPEKEIILVSRTGWNDLSSKEKLYACPNGVILCENPDVLIELSTVQESSVALKSGTLEEWKETVRLIASIGGCEHWHLAAALPFAGVLIDLLKHNTCGINFSGQSSGGKTTALKIAVSAWTMPAEGYRETLMGTWLTTSNALEVDAAQANGTLLALDELSQASAEVVSQALYTLASGSGKSRGMINADNELATMKKKHWYVFVLSSGEQSIAGKIKKERMSFQAGMAVRIADIDVTETNRNVSPDVFNKIQRGINNNFGHAGEAFVRHLFETKMYERRDELIKRIEHSVHRLAGAEADSMKKRSAQIFALIDVGARIAQEAGILPDNLDIDHAVQWAWEKYLASDDAELLDPVQSVIEDLRNYVVARKGTSIKDVDNPEPWGGKVLGWYDRDNVYLPVESVMEATAYRWKKEKLSRVLTETGLISKREEPNRAIIRNVPNVGKVKAYALDRKMLLGDAEDFRIESITDGNVTYDMTPVRHRS